MRRFSSRLALLILLASVLPAADTLDIYFIDVEGGASTLVVTQAGQSVLMDAGYAGFDGRDVDRIERVLKDAGVARLDYFLTSHFHGDHVGGLAELAKRVEITTFVDHGDSVERESENGRPLWESYLAVVGDRRRVAEPGEILPLTGVELKIVAGHSRVLPAAEPGGGPNDLCGDFAAKQEDKGENGKSLGYLLRFGEFEFLNLGDLSWNFQKDLACPVNLLGKVDLFQVTHHGVSNDVLPQQMWSVEPTVAVMNNGPTKGAGRGAMRTVLGSPGLEDLWQLHLPMSENAGKSAPEQLTANLGETTSCTGNSIRASVAADGSYTLTNSRNGYAKTYRSK